MSKKISERSKAIRTAGTGAESIERTARGLAQQYMKRTPVVFNPSSGFSRSPIKSETSFCPRCKGTAATAKLSDDRKVKYCTVCRFAIPLPV